MKTYLDCYPCVLRQALEASRLATSDESIHEKVLSRVMSYLRMADKTFTPPQISTRVFRIIKEESKCEDPYYEIKQECNNIALNMYPGLKEVVRKSPDKILTAARIAIAEATSASRSSAPGSFAASGGGASAAAPTVSMVSSRRSSRLGVAFFFLPFFPFLPDFFFSVNSSRSGQR